MRQLTDDWQARYVAEDTPWEDSSPWPGLDGTLGRFVKKGSRVLDVGCGFGTNTIRLAELGYDVIGIDVAERAITYAKRRRAPSGCAFRVADFLVDECGPVDAVFDRGCFHSFASPAGRRCFTNRVFTVLCSGGLWIDVSGSTENGESAAQIEEMKLPRLSLQQIAGAVEPFFEIVEIERAQFGTSVGNTDFDAWVSVLRRKSAAGAG